MSKRNGGPPQGRRDLSLWGDVSDAELLGIIHDVSDENGWASSLSVRLQLGENIEDATETSRSGVGSRCAWLVRYGWLERGERVKDEDNRWWATYRLSDMGRALLLNPKLTAQFERTLSGLNAAQRLRLTRELAEAGHGAPMEIRTALRRQWLRSLGK